MRARALVQLGLMHEASTVLISLMRGASLPDKTLDTDYVVKNEDGSVVQVCVISLYVILCYEITNWLHVCRPDLLLSHLHLTTSTRTHTHSHIKTHYAQVPAVPPFSNRLYPGDPKN